MDLLITLNIQKQIDLAPAIRDGGIDKDELFRAIEEDDKATLNNMIRRFFDNYGESGYNQGTSIKDFTDEQYNIIQVKLDGDQIINL